MAGRNFFYIIVIIAVPAFSQPARERGRMPPAEKYRPQFHFSPLTKWTNDPNGLVYFEGEYHMFYQHFPDSSVWGPMHWGHAVSTDLFHWDHLPIALYPDSLGYIFSGSIVIDWKNSSGFGAANRPPMVAVFTYHDPVKDKNGQQCQSQALAYSTDKGRTWTKYDGNPVLRSPGMWNFRDPKVRWFEETERWIMTLACGDHVRFYSSADLINWNFESEFGKDAGFHGGTWECPDLVPVKVEGTRDSKWVLIVSLNPGGHNGGSGTQYFSGDFDGRMFTAYSKEGRWIDYGTDNYAGVTWSDLPAEDNRTIFIGWMSNWQYANRVPTSVWRNAMTLPRELTLKALPSGYVLHSFPVREAHRLRTGPKDIRRKILSSRGVATGGMFELDLVVDAPSGKKFSLTLANENDDSVTLYCDDEMLFDRTASGETGFEKGFAAKHRAVRPSGTCILLTVFVDASSVEIFANRGEVVMTELVFPATPYTRVLFQSDEGVEIKTATLYELRSILEGRNIDVSR